MLSIFHGTDYEKARTEFRAAVARAKEKNTEAAVLVIDDVRASEISPDMFVAPRLLGGARIVVLDEVEDVPGWGLSLENVAALAASPDEIFVCADAFQKSALTKATKAGAQVFEYKKQKRGKEKKEGTNPFSLTEAFAQKDKKRTWLLYRSLLREGAIPEELHGLLVWQIKALALAESASSVSATGLNPFVYGKAKAALSKWKEGEVRAAYRDLVVLYHEARLGRGELEMMLEKFLLR